MFETYDSRLGLIRGTCFAGQAVGQALFPHLLTELIETYGYSFSFIVYSGILLQALPAILLLRVNDSVKKPLSFSRYSDLAKTYAIFSNEGLDNNYYTAEVQLHDLSKKCWKSPSDDNLHREVDLNNDEVGFENDNPTITPPPSPEEKRRNIFGVEILPEIPEESEDEDEEFYASDKDVNMNKKRLSNAIKRLSTLGDSLDDYITKQIRRDSRQSENSDINEYSEVEVTYDNISPVTDIQREKIFNSFSFRCHSAYASMRRRMWMPSYRVYIIKRRLLYFMYNLNDTFIKPLTRSLSCWKFYPSLLLAFTKLSLTGISFVLLPILGTQILPPISTTEINFFMSLHGFTWVCFLLSTPWLAQTPKRNYKYVAVLGLVTSTVACFRKFIFLTPFFFSLKVFLKMVALQFWRKLTVMTLFRLDASWQASAMVQLHHVVKQPFKILLEHESGLKSTVLWKRYQPYCLVYFLWVHLSCSVKRGDFSLPCLY